MYVETIFYELLISLGKIVDDVNVPRVHLDGRKTADWEDLCSLHSSTVIFPVKLKPPI